MYSVGGVNMETAPEGAAAPARRRVCRAAIPSGPAFDPIHMPRPRSTIRSERKRISWVNCSI